VNYIRILLYMLASYGLVQEEKEAQLGTEGGTVRGYQQTQGMCYD